MIRNSKGDCIYIVEFSTHRRYNNFRDNNLENFSSTSGFAKPCDGSGRKERARETSEQARKGSRASVRVSALPPRDVVKYVAIYTGDWRHWRLGSKRARARSLLSPFLALFPGLPDSRPSVLIMSSSNPCAGRGGLPDQKSIWGIPVSAWAMQNRNRVRLLPALHSLSFKFIHRSFFYFFSTYSIDDIRFPGSSIAFRYLSSTNPSVVIYFFIIQI